MFKQGLFVTETFYGIIFHKSSPFFTVPSHFSRAFVVGGILFMVSWVGLGLAGKDN
jgi:hypothetical protein